MFVFKIHKSLNTIHRYTCQMVKTTGTKKIKHENIRSNPSKTHIINTSFCFIIAGSYFTKSFLETWCRWHPLNVTSTSMTHMHPIILKCWTKRSDCQATVFTVWQLIKDGSWTLASGTHFFFLRKCVQKMKEGLTFFK